MLNKIIRVFLILAGIALGLLIIGVSVMMFNLPPKQVPENLSAKEYYDLGVRYKIAGWTEQARKALQLAIKADPNGASGKKAQTYLNCYIPVEPVTKDAERRNISAVNVMFGSNKVAEDEFKALIKEYPNFEWPYGNLGAMYVEQKKPEEAKAMIAKALAINPNYVNAMLHLAQAQLISNEKDAALGTCKRALAADPDCETSPIISKYPDVKAILLELKKGDGAAENK